MPDFRNGDPFQADPSLRDGDEPVNFPREIKEVTADPTDVSIGDFWIRTDLLKLRFMTSVGVFELDVTVV